IDALHWIADAGQQILADERIPQPQAFTKLKKSIFSYEPLGVVGVIAPWNYPWSIPFGEVAMALMAGNGVVLKPASLTPLIGERIKDVFERGGLPEGLVRTVHGGGAVGNALAHDTEIGPMVSREQYELVKDLVDDAIAAGAELRCGGPMEIDGYPDAAFYAPAVLTGVTHDMRIMREEIFGPVVPIVSVDSEEEAIALANDSEFGLSASVWTLDRAKGDRIARRLEAGSVWINDHMYSHGTCQCSWGGVKDSGIGRAHSKFGFY